MKKLSKEIELKVIEMYNNQCSYSQIVKETGIHETSISRVIRRYNIPIRPLLKLTEQQVENFVFEYLAGNGYMSLSKKYHIGPDVAKKILTENGIELRPNGAVLDISKLVEDWNNNISLTQLCKKYKCSHKKASRLLKEAGVNVYNRHNELKFDNTVFDNINSEEKAYWLGFLYADGCVTGNKLEISLKESDKEHLYKLCDFVKCSHDKVKINKTNHDGCFRCRLTLINKHFANQLISLGCTERKSLTLTFPDISIFSDKKLVRHFIRGYFDGDGCISYADKTHTKPCISVLGTEQMCSSIVENTLKFPNKLYGSNKKDDIVKSYSVSGANALTFMYILYYNSNIYLDRKYQRFLDFKDCRFKEKSLKWLEDKIGEFWDENTEII